MRRRRIYFKRRKRRYKQRGRGCKAAANYWRPCKQFGKGEPEYIYQMWGCKKIAIKVKKKRKIIY